MILLALLGCGSSEPTPDEPRPPPPIAAAAAPAASGQLSVVVEQEGQDPRACFVVLGGEVLCPEPLAGAFPGPSRDGRVIVVRKLGEGWQLATYEEGRMATWTEQPFAVLRGPVWDADTIVFEGRREGTSELWRAAQGKPPTKLDSHPLGDFEPTVAPDGRIAFGTSRDEQAEIYVLADGEVQRITRDPADDTRPSFSPTGSLAWVSGRSGVNRIWVEGPRELYAGEGAHAGYAWSPDGSAIAAVVSEGGSTRLEIVKVDSGALLGSVEPLGIVSHPTWSPDGRWLAFTVEADGRASVWTAHRSGRDAGEAVAVTGASVWLPRWVR